MKIIEITCKQTDLDIITKNEIVKMCKVLIKSRKYQDIRHPKKLPPNRIFQICG
jgi:hypothetical protein